MDTKTIRKQLEEEREHLASQQSVGIVDVEENQGGSHTMSQHSADAATDLFLRDRDQAVQRDVEALIDQINAALKRLDNGTYGTCERCERPIEPERLVARPYAEYCLHCQETVEQEG